jgi:anti-sigma B factor antagonist
MRGLTLTIDELGPETVCMALKGELDLEHAYTFDEELKALEARRPSCVVIDLRELWFLDSTGLSRLLAARRRARRARRRLILVRGTAAVQRLLAMTVMDETFEIVSDVPAAVTA